MSDKIALNQKLGEIVSIFPDSVETFNKYKIDYCCGGHDTLSEAFEEKGINPDGILKELNEKYEEFKKSNKEYKDWRKEKPSVIVNHIVNTHHEYTKKELREVDIYMFKILKVHFEHHGEELLKLHRLFGNLKTELEEHLVKEEENLFPLILKYEKTGDENLLSKINKFIKDTEDEHDAAGDILKQMEKLTDDFTAPCDACATYQMVFAKLHGLQKDLFKHIYLENSVLFNMF